MTYPAIHEKPRMQAKTYFWEGPHAEDIPWGAPHTPIGLRVPPELVIDHTKSEIQDDE